MCLSKPIECMMRTVNPLKTVDFGDNVVSM
jgi:hypothetical protein